MYFLGKTEHIFLYRFVQITLQGKLSHMSLNLHLQMFPQYTKTHTSQSHYLHTYLYLHRIRLHICS